MRTDDRSPFGWPLAIAAIAALGLWLRVFGLTFGLPAVYNQDELAIMNRALALSQNHFSPHNFLYPTFYFYALFLWEGAFFIAGRLTGLYHALADFQREFFVDPSRIFIAGRMLSALCGTATIVATARLGTRLFDRATGLGAALFLAIAPFAVRDAHYVKHDVPVTLLIVLTLQATARLLVEPGARDNRRAWLAAGALAGLAMSTHYYAIFVTVPIVVVALFGDTTNESRVPRAQSLILAGAAATVVFFAASPFLLVEPGAFLRDVTGNRDIVMRASAHAGLFASLPDYLAMLWRDAAGGRTIAVAALAGLAVTCVNYRRPLVMLLSFAVPFLLFISNTAPATRYLNPLLPIMALFAALPLSLIGASASAAARRGRLVGMAYLIVVGTPILLASVGQDQFFNATDTRTLAQAFIEHQIPAGASVLLQPYSVPLRQSREGLVESLRENLGSETRATIKYRSRLALDPYPTPGYRTIYLGEFSAGSRAAGNDPDKIYISPATVTGAMGLAPLRARGVDYVVLKYNGVDPSLQPLLGALSREALLLAEFSPYRSAATEAVRARVPPFVHNADARIDAALERPGPVIRIWRITK